MKYSRGPVIKRRLAQLEADRYFHLRDLQIAAEEAALQVLRREKGQKTLDERVERRALRAAYIVKQQARPWWKKFLHIYV